MCQAGLRMSHRPAIASAHALCSSPCRAGTNATGSPAARPVADILQQRLAIGNP